MLPKLTRTSTMGCITGSWIIRKEPFLEFAEVSVATIYLPFPLLCVRTFHLTFCQSRPTFAMMWNIWIVLLWLFRSDGDRIDDSVMEVEDTNANYGHLDENWCTLLYIFKGLKFEYSWMWLKFTCLLCGCFWPFWFVWTYFTKWSKPRMILGLCSVTNYTMRHKRI